MFAQLPVLGAPGARRHPRNAPRDAWAPDLAGPASSGALYYAVSQFGTKNSVIGLLTSPTLDPASPDTLDGPGLVLRSQPGVDDFNAIDPEFVTDADGGDVARLRLVLGRHPARAGSTRPPASCRTARSRLDRPARVRPERRGEPVDRLARGVLLPVPVVRLLLPRRGERLPDGGRPRHVDHRTLRRRRRRPAARRQGGTEVMRGYNEFVGDRRRRRAMAKNGRTGTSSTTTTTRPTAARPAERPARCPGDGTGGRGRRPDQPEPLGRPRRRVRPDRRAGSGAVVENVGCGYEGANIALWTDLDDACQQWQLSDRGNGTRTAQQVQQQGRRGRRVRQRRRRQRRPVGLDRVPAEQRLPAVELHRGRRRLDDGREHPARQPGVDGPERPGAGSNVAISSPTGGTDQQFRFEPVGACCWPARRARRRRSAPRGASTVHGHGGTVGFQPRDERACQTWRFEPVAGTATYVVRTAETAARHGSGACLADDLRLVRRGCDEWTLVPTNDGTWSLSSGGTIVAVRLLLP